ncbi:MAG: hypothetical protein WCY41_05245 [Candidatus Micrarchaeia archaeon]
MQKSTGFDIRGKHTAITGTVSPFHVNVGSRQRVRAAAAFLKDARLLEGGRVEILLGTYEHKTGEGKKLDVPVVIYETQMGMGAADIISREVLHFSCCEPVFRFNGSEIRTAERIVDIRAGTSGGCNTSETNGISPVLAVGDIVAAERMVGTSGTIMQALGFMPTVSSAVDTQMQIELFKTCQKWGALGGSITKEGYLAMDTDPLLAREIWGAAFDKGLTCHIGTVFSKESLYSESNHGFFVDLRKNQNVLATEMEGLQIAYVAAEARKKGIDMLTGVVAGIVGVVPGTGFPNNKSEEDAAKKVETDGVKVALAAIGRFAESMRR